MTKEERIEKILEAKELGLKAVTIEGVIYDLDGSKPIRPLVVIDPTEAYKEESVFDQMTDEEVLFWSTPEYDNIQEKKKKHQEHLNKEVNDGKEAVRHSPRSKERFKGKGAKSSKGERNRNP